MTSLSDVLSVLADSEGLLGIRKITVETEDDLVIEVFRSSSKPSGVEWEDAPEPPTEFEEPYSEKVDIFDAEKEERNRKVELVQKKIIDMGNGTDNVWFSDPDSIMDSTVEICYLGAVEYFERQEKAKIILDAAVEGDRFHPPASGLKKHERS